MFSNLTCINCELIAIIFKKYQREGVIHMLFPPLTLAFRTKNDACTRQACTKRMLIYSFRLEI
jgi:hypothetical protein